MYQDMHVLQIWQQASMLDDYMTWDGRYGTCAWSVVHVLGVIGRVVWRRTRYRVATAQDFTSANISSHSGHNLSHPVEQRQISPCGGKSCLCRRFVAQGFCSLADQ